MTRIYTVIHMAGDAMAYRFDGPMREAIDAIDAAKSGWLSLSPTFAIRTDLIAALEERADEA